MSCPGQGVRAQVALQVDQIKTGDITKLIELKRPDVVASRSKAIKVVELTGGMERCCFVPPSAISGKASESFIVHWLQRSSRSRDHVLSIQSKAPRRSFDF